ncbi:MAG: orotidine-5'-phosphate decarboxylase [Clostridia bacterium]|jgi:orotidine-5'-phosphate decarboxylase|nr:orotidine-5'-phosphate decarboxylase [Clostridia bacterium]
MIDKLIEKIIELQNPTCVGLDTSFDYLPDELKKDVSSFDDAAEAIAEFNMNVIDKVCDIVPSVKVQIAYYETYGHAGLQAFEYTVNYARGRGLIVIADCKRNDIGSTASCYSKAYLGTTNVNGKLMRAFSADMLTVNGYLGSDGIKPFVEDIKSHDKSIFVLVKTSNPSSGELQNLKLESGKFVYEHMGELVAEWGKDTVGKYGYSEVGAVVGATHPEEAARLRKQLPHTFFLIPGYGAQGGSAEMLKVCFDKNGLGGVVNSSRGIICAYKDARYVGMNYAEAARAACIDMQQDLSKTIGVMKRV